LLNYLYFDREGRYRSGGFRQVSRSAQGAFEELTLSFVAPEEGYVYAYTSNQTAEDLDVFFDDSTGASQRLVPLNYTPGLQPGSNAQSAVTRQEPSD
jgi:hypothetical protein